jgi:mono/diheme cytochrome c family protein
MIVCLRRSMRHQNFRIACFLTLGIMATSLTAASQTSDKMEQTANDFKANCTNCHAETGGGTALGNRLHVKNLYSKEVLEKSTADLAQTIRAGKEICRLLEISSTLVRFRD